MMVCPELALDNQLCFLIHRLDRSMVALYKQPLAALKLTYPQYLAMLALWEREKLSVGELCRLLHLDTGTVSPLVSRLRRLGYIDKRRGSDDERTVELSLTPIGRDLREKALNIPATIAGCLLAQTGDRSGESADDSAGESVSEYAAMRELLERLLERIGG